MANPIRKLTEVIIGAPDVPSAEERAKAARAATIEAGAAVQAARAALTAADEASDPGQIQKAEAALVAAERAADRATRALEAAERRLQLALDSEGAAAREEGVRQLRQAAERHQAASKQAEEAVRVLGNALAGMRQADADIGALQRQGFVSANAVAGHSYGPNVSRRRIELALIGAGVLDGRAPEGLEPLATWSGGLGRLLLGE